MPGPQHLLLQNASNTPATPGSLQTPELAFPTRGRARLRVPDLGGPRAHRLLSEGTRATGWLPTQGTAVGQAPQDSSVQHGNRGDGFEPYLC